MGTLNPKLTQNKNSERSSRKLLFRKMSVQVKAILHRGPNEEELPRKEIRRFEIEASAAGSYEFLRAKIVALYPDLTADSPFRLMWTDDEGDNGRFWRCQATAEQANGEADGIHRDGCQL